MFEVTKLESSSSLLDKACYTKESREKTEFFICDGIVLKKTLTGKYTNVYTHQMYSIGEYRLSAIVKYLNDSSKCNNDTFIKMLADGIGTFRYNEYNTVANGWVNDSTGNSGVFDTPFGKVHVYQKIKCDGDASSIWRNGTTIVERL